MVRQLVRFMGRKRVALRARWIQVVNAAKLAAAQERRDAEVQAWKELGLAVQASCVCVYACVLACGGERARVCARLPLCSHPSNVGTF